MVLNRWTGAVMRKGEPMDDLISRAEAIRIASGYCHPANIVKELEKLPSAQPERLTDDDFETIRIHLNAYKETLCNQQRWEEAEEYQRIIDRFMAFADGQKPRTGKWIRTRTMTHDGELYCDQCEQEHPEQKIIWNFCPSCGAYMREGGQDAD